MVCFYNLELKFNQNIRSLHTGDFNLFCRFLYKIQIKFQIDELINETQNYKTKACENINMNDYLKFLEEKHVIENLIENDTEAFYEILRFFY